jgi:hypothetical protein
MIRKLKNILPLHQDGRKRIALPYCGLLVQWQLHLLRGWLAPVIFLILAALLPACGGADGRTPPAEAGDSHETTESPRYDPSRDYYDQVWEVVKDLIRPDMTAAEKAETLARWVVSNSTNARWIPEDSTYPLPEGARGSDDALLPFHGLCAGRSYFFKNLAERAGLRVSVFSIYNFSGPGHGHTCVQVYYENDWHFYDVTYAGMFVRNGEVLSFAEMRADPAAALSGMVVFEPTGETRDYYSSGLPVDNHIRMQWVYTEDTLANAISTSFRGSGNLVPLEVKFDLSILPIRVGDSSGTYADLNLDGLVQHISENMGVMLGHIVDNFEPILILTNAVPGQEYVLRFYIEKANTTGLVFDVTPKNAQIISGKVLTTTSEMLWPNPAALWEITFIPLSDAAMLTIHHECSEGHGILLKQVTIDVVQ